MKKMSILLFVLLSFLPASLSSRTWWDFNSTDYDYDYNDFIDFAAIKRIIEQEMDHLFEPRKQTVVNRNYINELKEFAQKEIPKKIKSSCSTHTQAKKTVVRLTQEFAIDTVVEWAAYIARELLKNPPVNPAYINIQKIVAAIKQIIRSQAQLALMEKDRRLTKTVQNLVENVELLVSQEIEYASAW